VAHTHSIRRAHMTTTFKEKTAPTSLDTITELKVLDRKIKGYVMSLVNGHVDTVGKDRMLSAKELISTTDHLHALTIKRSALIDVMQLFQSYD
jgi:hypothetical protein